jgi:hypothetical protein
MKDMILDNMGNYFESICSLGIGAAQKLLITNKTLKFSIHEEEIKEN